MNKMFKQLKRALTENVTLILRVAVDALSSGVVLFIIGKSAFISSNFVEGEVSASHDPVFIVFMTLVHAVALGVHGILFARLAYVGVKRIFKNIK